MKERPAISVIIPCRNASRTIVRALQSVSDQTTVPCEVVVADDGSDDETPELLDRCSKATWSFELKTLRLPRALGPGAARNAAWEQVSTASRYVAFLDADDMWLPRKIEVQVEWMDTHPHYGWTAHSCCFLSETDPAGAPSPRPRQPTHVAPLSRNRLLLRNSVATPTVMARTDAPARFRQGWTRCEDLMLWLDWINGGFAGAMIEEPLAALGRCPKAPGGLTGDLRGMFAGEMRVFDTLVAERRMSACAAEAWKLYARGRFQLRMLRA